MRVLRVLANCGTVRRLYSMDNRAVIAGGGIGGLAAALALARIGWTVTVLERRPQWSEAGAGIQLSPNGTAVLERLGVASRLAAAAGRPTAIVVRDGVDGRILQTLPLGAWIEARHGAPYWQVHRRDLQAALLAAVVAEPRITVRLGAEVVDAAEVDGGVAVRLLDGSVCQGRFVVGADGIFSGLRRMAPGDPVPRASGHAAFRTVVPVVTLHREPGISKAIDFGATGVWLARHAHVVHYPVRAGRDIAVVVIVTADHQSPEPSHGWSQTVAAAEVEAAIASSAPALAAVLGCDRDWRRWQLYECEPLRDWTRGRVVLLGDAAHPTLPFLAQGGSLALEDAWTLARHVGRARHDDAIATALAAYGRERAPRTRQVVSQARRNGVVFHLSGAARLARNAAMRIIPGQRVMAGYDWVYGWKPE